MKYGIRSAGLGLTMAAMASGQNSGFFLSPDKVPGGMLFHLSLLHYPQGCENFDYTDTTARVSNDTLYLSYVPRPSMLPVCRAEAYGPGFDIPALQGPAVYTVMATAIPACLLAIPPCIIIPEPRPSFVGTLTVTNPLATPIWLNPNRAPARQAFTLIVQSRDFQCNDLFSNQRVGVAGIGLFLSFSYAQSRILCPVPDTAVKTVSFPVPDPGLAFRLDGKYAVHWTPDSSCASGSYACTSVFRGTPFDTVFLYEATPVLPEKRRTRNGLRWNGLYPSGIIGGYRVDGRKAFRHKGVAP